jgi:uncharacterized protein (TIGR03089 family)
VAKSANLLVDGLGVPPGSGRVGLLLPLHWQAVALLLAGAAVGAEVVIAADPAELAGCDAAFTTAGAATAALDAGAGEVLALSCTPLGTRLPELPALVADYAAEVPGHGDHWAGPPAPAPRLLVGGAPVPGQDLAPGLSPADRLLVALPLTRPGPLLAALAAGAAAVLVPDPAAVDLGRAVQAERVTATAGVDVVGLPRLDRRGPT